MWERVLKRRLIALAAVLGLGSVAGSATGGGTSVITAAAGKGVLLRAPHRPAQSTSWPNASPRPRRAPLAGPAFVPGFIVVKFEPTLTAQAVERVARAIGARGITRPSYADFVYVELPLEADPAAAAAALAGQPGVVYAEPDPVRHPAYRPNDPLYTHQWNLQRLDMERAWDINPGARSDVVVAVLDTGVAFLDEGAFAQAPDLRGTRFVPGYDFIWDDAEPVDFDGHGTHVSGTIAQTTGNGEGVAGIAFSASLMPVKVLFTYWDEQFGAPDPYGASAVARGIRFAAENGAKVINMSLGGVLPSTPEEDAMRYAVERGVFIAIAAGNHAVSCDDCPPGIGPNPVEYPAKYAEDLEGAMAVAALDYNLERAFYSNVQSYVEIGAPGGDVGVDLSGDGFGDGVLQQTLDPAYVEAGLFDRFSYEFFEGTSMATPHVAGFAALLISQGVTSPAAVEAAIKRFATDTAPAGRDPFTGYGALNPPATLQGLGIAR